MHCTALHCTALHCTVLQCTKRHCTALYCTAIYFTSLNFTALHCTTLCKKVFFFFFFFFQKSVKKGLSLYQCYYPHTSRESMSPVCGIFSSFFLLVTRLGDWIFLHPDLCMYFRQPAVFLTQTHSKVVKTAEFPAGTC